MAPVRDREGERRGWYWLEDEAYLFLAGGVRSFGWFEKVFDTKIGILVSKTCPSPRKRIKKILSNPDGTLVRDTVFSVNFQRKLWVGYRRTLMGTLRD